MKIVAFSRTGKQLKDLSVKYPNLGKNSDVGKWAVAIATLFFQFKDPMATISIQRDGVDLILKKNGTESFFEIKGTTAHDLAWNKLKVSSEKCANLLIKGMTLLRITCIGERDEKLYFMKFEKDFLLVLEPRWSVRRVKIVDP